MINDFFHPIISISFGVLEHCQAFAQSAVIRHYLETETNKTWCHGNQQKPVVVVTVGDTMETDDMVITSPVL